MQMHLYTGLYMIHGLTSWQCIGLSWQCIGLSWQCIGLSWQCIGFTLTVYCV